MHRLKYGREKEKLRKCFSTGTRKNEEMGSLYIGSEKHVKVRNRSQERVRRVDLDFLRIREELEIDLQEKLKSKNLLVFLFDKKGADAPLSELVKHHDTKQCNPKCDKQIARTVQRLPSTQG